jgi:RNA polymerase sigma-70 factor (ECF subfamily)
VPAAVLMTWKGTVHPGIPLPTREEDSVDLPASVRKPPVVPDELRIIDKIKRGDAEAFEKLYRSYAGRVYASCLRLSGDPDRAEELTQDVFLRLWEKIDTFKGRSAFSSWLYRLTVNLVIDKLRSEQRRHGWESMDDDVESFPYARGETSPDTRLALETAIASLPFGARIVFVLHDIEGYRHEEIGEMTGMATGTSKAQLHRARRLLRKMLG